MQVIKKVTRKGNVIYDTLDGIRVARTCSTCKLLLPASKFSVNKQKIMSNVCNACGMKSFINTYQLYKYENGGNKYRKRYRDKNSARSAEEVQAIKDKKYPNGLKKCSQCKKEQPLSEYYTFNGNPDGMHYHCKTCYRK